MRRRQPDEWKDAAISTSSSASRRCRAARVRSRPTTHTQAAAAARPETARRAPSTRMIETVRPLSQSATRPKPWIPTATARPRYARGSADGGRSASISSRRAWICRVASKIAASAAASAGARRRAARRVHKALARTIQEARDARCEPRCAMAPRDHEPRAERSGGSPASQRVSPRTPWPRATVVTSLGQLAVPVGRYGRRAEGAGSRPNSDRTATTRGRATSFGA